ncbi:hypothetical protein CKO11_00630 [Rhodobacter sp. TJ_12]|uniref:L,D-transpeptidase family protein n=1 Tax=Rhodobacter sp. TJ_12 TaxID=2029399 RepID=UPI001CBDD6FE|nr:L,D-transpeptidase family protein [Rhodobacter sp. TJ_12]MBZ4020965.1 hypothetical protein [Rhodobacter sp. TJ_12]
MIRLTPGGLVAFGRRYSVQIGRGGLSTCKQEGDGATPVGRWRVLEMLYRADRLPRPAPWARPIGPQDLWCDAADHPAYNQPVRAPFAASHERLARPDPLYDIVLVTDWNYPQTRPGKGSAIFLHQRRRLCYPTAGCLALRRKDLMALARKVTPGTEILVPPLACFQLGKDTPKRGGATPSPHDKA